MRAFGFLGFGRYAFGSQCGPSTEEIAKTRLEITQAADEIGVSNASFRVHHFALRTPAPMPLLCAIVATAKVIEAGTDGVDIR